MATDSDVMVPAADYNAENFLDPGLLANWIRPLIAEFIGPFALTFIGAGSIMVAFTQGFNNGGTLVMVALAHGLAIGLMIAGAGHISGGHFNPAVTVGMWLGGRIGTLKAIGYIVAQLAGAVVAALFLYYIFPAAVRDGTDFGVPTLAAAGANKYFIVGRVHGLVIEAILTFFLMFVITGSAVDKRGFGAIAPLAIGLTITMDIFMGGPLTGAAMNPSRQFGVALVHGEWSNWWVYWVGPIFGACVASIVHNYIFIPKSSYE
jgi:aquaporin TIP